MKPNEKILKTVEKNHQENRNISHKEKLLLKY